MSVEDEESVEISKGSPNCHGIGRFSWFSIALLTILIIVGLGGLLWLLTAMSEHVFAGNSDAATVVLEGQSIHSGHLLLQGWNLSRDSFWSVDALWYALVLCFTGVRALLMHIVPALLVAACIGVGLWFIRQESRARQSWAGLLVLLLLVGVPSPVLSFFLLQGPWHVGTVLWCLIAFAGLSFDGWGWGFVLAVIVLAAGLLGDLETLPFAVVPVILAGLCEMVRCRSWRHGLPSVVAGVVSCGVAWELRALVRHLHGLSISTGITQASSSQYPKNIHDAFTWLGALFGVKKLALGANSIIGRGAPDNGPVFSRLSHIPLLILVAVVGLASIYFLLRGLVKGEQNIGQNLHRPHHNNRAQRIDAFLLFGVAGSIADFIVLCPNTNGSYARYLSAAAIFAAILAARYVTRYLPRIKYTSALVVVGVVLAVAGSGIGVSVAQSLQSPQPKQGAVALANFLEQHHLTVGVGDYWSASIVTVVSNGRITVRPVITNPGNRIKRYERQSSSSWYKGVKFQFLVYNVLHPWRDINAKTATWTFGRPKKGYDVGPYRVIVWSHPLAVSPVGYTNG